MLHCYLAGAHGLPKELQLCFQATLFPPAAGTSSSIYSHPWAQTGLLYRTAPAQAHPHPLATAGHVYRPRLARPSGKLLAMAEVAVFVMLLWPVAVFVMTSTKRSESLTSGTRDSLLVPLLSTLFQPRGNCCSFVSASSGHLLSSFTSLSDHLLLFWLTTPYIFPVQITGVASVSGLYSEYLLIFSIVCFLIC